jgi:hypothetical protein
MNAEVGQRAVSALQHNKTLKHLHNLGQGGVSVRWHGGMIPLHVAFIL